VTSPALARYHAVRRVGETPDGDRTLSTVGE
jgi:hypothetical protein